MIIAPNDPNIIYSPYNWLVTPTFAKTINAGAVSRVLIGGASSVALTFDVSALAAPLPRIGYQIDNNPPAIVPIAASIPLPLPTDSTWPKHRVRWWVDATSETLNRWNAAATAVKFQGYDVAGAAATVPIPRNPQSIAIFGDSIPEGVRTLRTTAASGQDVDRNSAAVATPLLLSQLLPAEIGAIAFGRQGWGVNGNGGVPPLPDSWALLWNGVARAFDPMPDFLVIPMGTNDGTADTTAVQITTYRAMLATLPTTRIIAMRPLNGAQASNMQTAVATIDNPRLTYLDTAGWWVSADAPDGLHPYGYAHHDFAARLAAHVIDLLAAKPPALVSNRSIFTGSSWITV